jgi:hypothetical protein
MKKNDLKKLALMGISGGIMVASQAQAQDRGFSNQGYFYNQDQNQTYYYQQGPNDSSNIQQNTERNQWTRNYQDQRYNNMERNQGNSGNYNQDNYQNYRNNPYLAANDENPTDSQFKLQLSVQGKSDFDNLSPDGKTLAIKMASHDCSGKNECKGQNTCQSAKNTCAGKGACKGQSSCKMSPDKAVQIATMKDKRTSMNNTSSRNTARF